MTDATMQLPELEPRFIIKDKNTRHVVVAPPGFVSLVGGLIQRDPTVDPKRSGPEWSSSRRKSPHMFKSHRAAARVANQCGNVIICEV